MEDLSMDSIDFERWLADLGRKFPALRAWVRAIEPEADHHALIDGWHRAMDDLDPADCLEANERMLAGHLDGPGYDANQWQALPARMRRHCAALREERVDQMPRRQLEERECQRNLFVRDRREAGQPLEQISSELVAAGYEPLGLRDSAEARK